MPEFFLELFSEEIPARMQARAADDLARLVGEALAALAPAGVRSFYGPRRIAMAVEVAGSVAESRSSERGPRVAAPEQALAGFLRKHGAEKAQLRAEGDFWVLDKAVPGVDAAALIVGVLPGVLRRFPWPKSMRWGGSSGFTWVRPLRRITCLLDGEVVWFDLRDGEDDGHGLTSSNETEGHRFMAPGAVAVSSCADWAAKLRERWVLVEASERRALIAKGLADLAATHGLALVEDAGLLDEVAGLVEWPFPFLGRIDGAYMDLPAEVMQVSMRVNQRYFAFRDAFGNAAPYFAFVANIDPTDGGAVVVAGNERVLRARFADARHFWDLDRKMPLEDRVMGLNHVTFHARLGSQGGRASRIAELAKQLAKYTGADVDQAEKAGRLCKVDLLTGMVGEFPELQGVMGGYYAAHDGLDPAIAAAIRDHYAPKGPGDAVPSAPVAMAVALADKLDTLAGFFAIEERPTGSGDPYALRRAALGVIRIVIENGLRVQLETALDAAVDLQPVQRVEAVPELIQFIFERLRVKLRTEGARYDVLNAVLGSIYQTDLVALLARTDAVAAMLGTEDGANLLAGYRRADNILRIEEKKDGKTFNFMVPEYLEVAEEVALAGALDRVEPAVTTLLAGEDFGGAMVEFAALRPFLDAFFSEVTVNDARREVRLNRLGLLARVRAVMGRVTDFSRIVG